ncbi:sulfite exporter TauE/SafE family protein [Rummeliibacillus pycnus]|uniref:sulfite exporter TauE/SafE family protein n=1 Tax=Rummeliibacillus pycnus TaxID=101070 RepID=UPI000C9B8663|nr:sulfite exporter TauE/SafE family protein [Rummeliibacillus pycnus]
MSLSLIIVLFCIGLIGSFISGMLGIGGAIIKFPMLLYIPAAFGVASFTSHEVSGITAVEILVTSISGVLAFRKGNYLNLSLIATMGISVLVGSLIGSFASSGFSEEQVNIVYGVFAILAAILMLVPRKQVPESEDKVAFNKPLAAILALIVGIGSGVVGAGGGFLLVPIMLVILKIPTRMTVASSLAITFISSIGGSIGKITTGQVEWLPVLILAIASTIAAPLGAKAAKKMNTKVLQVLLSILIVATAIKIWIDILM